MEVMPTFTETKETEEKAVSWSAASENNEKRLERWKALKLLFSNWSWQCRLCEIVFPSILLGSHGSLLPVDSPIVRLHPMKVRERVDAPNTVVYQ